MVKSISLCLIARNEEADIGRCLQSVQGLVQEMIVVDTGSDDRTIAIAKEFGAKVINSEWVDDFSVPRNVALKAATGEWILVLDADEALDRSDFTKIRQLLELPNSVFQLIPRHYCSDYTLLGFIPHSGEYPHWEQGSLGYLESTLVRLFPNDPRIEYRNCMHELVEESIREISEYKVVNSGIRIHHFSRLRSPERIKWKQKLYSRLGSKKVATCANHWKSHYENGVGLTGSGDFQEAITSLIRATELNPLIPDSWLALGHAYGELGQYTESERCLKQALLLDPKLFQAYAHLGVVYLRTKHDKQAANYFSKAVELNGKDLNTHLNLGDALLNLNAFEKAKQVFLRSLDLIRDNPRGLTGLGIANLMLYKFGEAECALLKVVEHCSQENLRPHFWLAQVYEKAGKTQQAISMAKMLLDKMPKDGSEPLRVIVEKQYHNLTESMQQL